MALNYRNRLLKTIILTIVVLVIFTGVSAVLFAYFRYGPNFLKINPTGESETQIPVSNLKDQQRQLYIELDESNQSYILAQQFDQYFEFVFLDSTQESQYLYEKYFIRANIMNEYERLHAIFYRSLSKIVQVQFTTDQGVFEERYGFKYADKIPFAGLAESDRILIYIQPDYQYSKSELRNTLAHELVHLFQFDSVQSSIYSHPEWFSEGTAEFYTSYPFQAVNENEGMKLFSSLDEIDAAIRSGDLQNTADGYYTAHLFISFLVKRDGIETLNRLIFSHETYPSFAVGFQTLYGSTADELYSEFLRSSN